MKPEAFKVVCAWCGAELGIRLAINGRVFTVSALEAFEILSAVCDPAPLLDSAPVSHGVCPCCAAALLSQAKTQRLLALDAGLGSN